MMVALGLLIQKVDIHLCIVNYMYPLTKLDYFNDILIRLSVQLKIGQEMWVKSGLVWGT